MKLGKVEIQVIDNGYTVSGSQSLHGFGNYQECRMCFETIDQTLDFLRTQLITPIEQLERAEEVKTKLAEQRQQKQNEYDKGLAPDQYLAGAVGAAVGLNPFRK